MTSRANQERFPLNSKVIPSAKYHTIYPRSKVKVGRLSGYSMRADMVRVAWDQTKYPGVGLTVDFIDPKPAELKETP